jgi:hypothetical protein
MLISGNRMERAFGAIKGVLGLGCCKRGLSSKIMSAGNDIHKDSWAVFDISFFKKIPTTILEI